VRTTKLITISISPDLLEKADVLAQQEDRTRSAVFREALRSYIKRKQKGESGAEESREEFGSAH